MKRRIYAHSLAGVLATGVISSFGFVAVSATAAPVETPGCTSRSEYRDVYRGIRKSRVDRIFDTDGSPGFWSFPRKYERFYQVCDLYPRDYYVSIIYRKGTNRLLHKDWNPVERFT